MNLFQINRNISEEDKAEINKKISSFCRRTLDYCNSLDALYSIENKLRKRNKFFKIQSVDTKLYHHPKMFLCEICRLNELDFTFYPEVSVYGDSPSEALSLAIVLMIDNGYMNKKEKKDGS